MESTEQMVKEILEYFLYQHSINKMESDNGEIKVYRVGDNLVRVDIKVKELNPIR